MTAQVASNPLQKKSGQTRSRISVLAAAVLVSACAPQVSQQDFASFRSAAGAGNYPVAASVASALAKPAANGRGTELLWTLNSGLAELHAGNPNHAITQFDAADDVISASEASSFNWNSQYRFGGYDAVMVNTYKTLAMLAKNDPAGARVEANRADERTRRVVQRFEREISADQAKVEKQRADGDAQQQALSNASADPAVREQMQALERWGSYRPFVNPAATYVQSVLQLNSGAPGDAEMARNGFERVAGIIGRSVLVQEDMALARAAASGRRPGNQVWVIFEDGQSPVFQQMNITVPMPVAARGGGVTVRPVTVSLPKMVPQPNAYTALDVEAGKARTATTTIGSIEGVMASEFRRRYPSLVAGAVLEALAKAAAVSAANAAVGNRAGSFGLLVDIAATAAANVTSSDTRSWYLLPREFQAARMPAPADGTLTLRARDGSASKTVTVPTDRPSIVHVKAQDPGSPLVVQVYRL